MNRLLVGEQKGGKGAVVGDAGLPQERGGGGGGGERARPRVTTHPHPSKRGVLHGLAPELPGGSRRSSRRIKLSPCTLTQLGGS